MKFHGSVGVWLVSVVGVASAFAPSHHSKKAMIKGVKPTSTFVPSFSSPRMANSVLYAKDDDDNENNNKKSSKKSAKKKSANKKKKKSSKNAAAAATSAAAAEEAEKKAALDREQKKKEIMAKLKEKLEAKSKEEKKSQKGFFFDNLNPFKAGQNVRKTIDTLASMGSLPSETRQKYFLDDRFQDGGGALFSERNPYLERLERENYVPEVLVVGATGEVGRLVVRRLLLEGRFKVRVLVRDLYSQTLNLLGTGVTYCQGDLFDMDSLEYALTDVDKIVFCASAPRPDEPDFQKRFESFVKETLDNEEDNQKVQEAEKNRSTKSDMEWEQLDSILAVRSDLAEQVDCIGMQNLVRAYQNVRFADYGTSQAAKRTLFKFNEKSDDFNLFALDEDDDDITTTTTTTTSNSNDVAGVDSDNDEKPTATASLGGDKYDEYEDYYDKYNDDYADEYADDYDEYADNNDDGDSSSQTLLEERKDQTVRAQCQWIRNKFGRAVFFGKVPKATSSTKIGGEASIVTGRLRARDEPEQGIDFSSGFGGFIARVCGDGATFEAFVRTSDYDDYGIEYVCEFDTISKPFKDSNRSNLKFTSVRLPFENFKPVIRSNKANFNVDTNEFDQVDFTFDGSDVQKIGFRYRSSRNMERSKFEQGENSSFYLSLAYIKLYRSQPEPEFVYLSDARIPRVISNRMIRHDQKRIVLDAATAAATTKSTSLSSRGPGIAEDAIQLFDEKTLQVVADNKLARSPEETYFKYRGEEILKSSGLSYAILRVAGFNESPSGEASTIDLTSTNDKEIFPVSRDEVAQVCVSALLDPNALNKSIYMGKRAKGTSRDENISAKFAALPKDFE